MTTGQKLLVCADTIGDDMGWKLFLDDERYPVDGGWIIARSYDDAVWCVESYGFPDYVSFDHDLGGIDGLGLFAESTVIPSREERDGYDFAKWLCQHAMDRRIYLRDFFGFTVHSQNPVGAENIRSYLRGFMESQDG